MLKQLLVVVFTLLFVAVANGMTQELSAERIHAMLRAGETTCVDVTSYYMNRIRAFDKMPRALQKEQWDLVHGDKNIYIRPPCCTDGPAPNSIISSNPLWKTYANALDQHFNQTGTFVGPLHCIPVILKDNINTHDMPTSSGAVALQYMMAPIDAEVTHNLRQAGAIPIAKANLAEFAGSGTNTLSSLGGETVNPYAFNRTVYGSSGGTAAAIAADLGVLGVGTDTCGSIVGPSASCNLWGLRSSIHKVPVRGVAPGVRRRDVVGPMTRSVKDAALALDAMLFGDIADHYTYSRNLDKSTIENMRVGFFSSLMVESSQRTDESIRLMMISVYTWMDNRFNTHIVNVTEGAAPLNDLISQMHDVESQCVYAESHTQWNEYLAAFGPNAPVQTFKELEATKQYLPRSSVGLHLLLNSTEKNETACDEFERLRSELQEAILAVMQENDVQLLLYPVFTNPVPEATRFGKGSGASFCQLSAYSGLPTLSMPTGFLDMDGEPVPVGMLVMADLDQEQLLLDYGLAYESIQAPRRASPLIPLYPLNP